MAFDISDKFIQRYESVEQMRQAYNERRAAVNQEEVTWSGSAWSAGSTAITAGTKIQSSSFFVGIQGWIENNCGDFLDPTITDYSGEATIPTIHDLATIAGQTDWEYFCKTICSGTTLVDGANYGWRRSTTKYSFTTRGRTEVGDYIRWNDATIPASPVYFDLWQDIRVALSKLKITLLRSSSSTYSSATIAPKSGGGLYKEGQTTGGTSAADDYDAFSPTASSDYPYGRTWASNIGESIDDCYAASCAIDYYVFDTSLVNDISLYYKTSGYITAYDSFNNGLSSGLYSDVGYTFSPTTNGVNTSGQMVSTVGSDFDWTLVTTSGSYVGFKRYNGTEDLRGIIVWDFTNSD